MDHSYFKDRISAYHDHSLKPEEMVVVEEHLAECVECRELLEKLERLDRMVEEHSQLAGDEYWERSAERIEARLGLLDTEVVTVTEKAPTWGWWRWVAVAASVGVLTFVGLHEKDIFESSPSTKTESPATRNMAPLETLDDEAGTSQNAIEGQPAETLGTERSDEIELPVEKKEQPKPAVRDELSKDEEQVATGPARIPVPVQSTAETRAKRNVTSSAPASSTGVDVNAASAKPSEPTPPQGTASESLKPTVVGMERSKVQLPPAEKSGAAGAVAEEQADMSKNIQARGQDLDTPSATSALLSELDSLSRLLYSEADTRRQTRSLMLQTVDKGKSESDSLAAIREQTERQLLTLCEQIAQFSKDSVEVHKSMEIIGRMAADSTSRVREDAKVVLENLRRVDQ